MGIFFGGFWSGEAEEFGLVWRNAGDWCGLSFLSAEKSFPNVHISVATLFLNLPVAVLFFCWRVVQFIVIFARGDASYKDDRQDPKILLQLHQQASPLPQDQMDRHSCPRLLLLLNCQGRLLRHRHLSHRILPTPATHRLLHSSRGGGASGLGRRGK